MPIEYYIDHKKRLVVARGVGVFGGGDVFGYQREVWSKPEVTGYDELVDMSAVTQIATPLPTAARMRQLARESTTSDPVEGASRFAIVAPNPLAFGLGREYGVYRELDPYSKKQVGVFRALADALAFLGIEALETGEFKQCQNSA